MTRHASTRIKNGTTARFSPTVWKEKNPFVVGQEFDGA
jgi:hypothetical protein